MSLTLDDVRRAWEARDPELVKLVAAVAAQPDEEPETPVRDGAPTFDQFLAQIRSSSFIRKPAQEQMQYRIAQVAALEAPTAEVPLPARLRLHEILLALWQDDSPYARSFLRRIIATVPLVYGPWRALKRVFKEAEAKNDTEIFGAIAARLDRSLAARDFGQVNPGTLAYLVRRGWRFLRRTAQTLPACYADFAADVLAAYPDDTPWDNTWIFNHIVHHETKQYGRSHFRLQGGNRDLLKHRAFAELWQRTPRPLFALLERAQSDMVGNFAANALKADFRALLREVEPAWVVKLINVGKTTIDEFVVWILNNVPRFEQAAFRTLGLHEAVLRLLDSPAGLARAYAARYARVHARDLGIPELIRLAGNSHADVRKLALDLLLERDPRKDVGLEAWGQLLESEVGTTAAVAADVLRKHFGASELTPQWFSARLFSESTQAFNFVSKLLPEIHPSTKLGIPFFAGLIDRVYDTETVPAHNVTRFALTELARFDANTFEADFLRRLFLNPLTRAQAIAWINEGKLKPSTLPAEFFKALAFHPEWDADPWLVKLREGPKLWMRQLAFSEELADVVLGWLADPRRFTPREVGFDWLMQLVARSEPRYHDFAVNTMNRAFKPPDFAPLPGAGASLGGALVLFTGHMAGTTQAELETRVKKAGGVVAVGVSSKLHYLVVGDQDSALQDKGPKTGKQIQAEEANAAGGNVRIMGEADFLRMLEMPAAPTSADPTIAGCERLWSMVIAPGPTDAPVAQFALKYLRLHHADIGAEEAGQPVEEGSTIPAAFLTYARVEPLFFESRPALRPFALELAKWEFARWSPAPRALLRLCEAPFADVRQFVANALLSDDAPEHRRYRIDPDVLSPAAVYSFCESHDESTRILGMILIGRSPKLRLPEELFRLAESPDRQVRAFVIRALWALYRDRGITTAWKPWSPAAPTIGANAKKAAAAAQTRGIGAPARPSHPPAQSAGLSAFLRRVLFEIPPGRLTPSNVEQDDGIRKRLKPISARKAKLALVEVMRDLAMEDPDFARGILPLLKEFMGSRGKSEQAACLVAVTRIKSAYAVQ